VTHSSILLVRMLAIVRNISPDQMKNMRVRGKLIWTLILIVILASLLYPYETTVVPQWTVKVVDEAGSPLAKVAVTEYWWDASVESEDHHAESISDGKGYITFPRRTIRGSLIRRVVPLINRLNVHGGSGGPHAFLIVAGDMNSTTHNSDYFPGQSLPEEIVLTRLK
jgi:hypothetical protein